MQELGRDGENVTISVSKDELSALGATLLEALDGGDALPRDVWDELVGYPRELVRGVLDDVVRVLDA